MPTLGGPCPPSKPASPPLESGDEERLKALRRGWYVGREAFGQKEQLMWRLPACTLKWSMRLCYGAAVMIAVCVTAICADHAAPEAAKELNGLIRSVHTRLLKLKPRTPWLSTYDEK